MGCSTNAHRLKGNPSVYGDDEDGVVGGEDCSVNVEGEMSPVGGARGLLLRRKQQATSVQNNDDDEEGAFVSSRPA